ncbi:MAG: PstS family phosphate ABC transporter substrate-binding protein [Leptolyngbyaceae cyanobacterium MAG.088]|nr:PstS family phosphate ABC transporter substrate-binding protein [Leptolyngbyaceae cyanobacterium MAG.088]
MQQQNKTLLGITLVGLGIIAGVFGLFTWIVGGRGGSGPVTRGVDGNPSASVPSAGTKDSLKGLKNVPQGLFNYGGSTTWIPVHELVNETIVATFPEFQLRYTLPSTGAPGSGTGIKMLLDGQLSFAESSRPLKDNEYEVAQQRGFTLEQVPAAIDGIALAVHPDLGLEGLTIEEIQAIYKSEVTNWSELGGPDLPIGAYSRSPEAAGTAKYFLDSVVNAEAYGANVVFVGDTTTGLRRILEDKGGIYYASAPEIVNQCSIYAIPVAAQNQSDDFIPPFAAPWRTGQACLDSENTVNKDDFRSGDYPLTRRLFVIVKVDGEQDETAGRAYANMLLSSEGQTLIEQAGFVSVR